MKTHAPWFAVVGLCGAGVLACGREGDSAVGTDGPDAGPEGGSAGAAGTAGAGGSGGSAGGEPDGSAGTAGGIGGSAGEQLDAGPDAPVCDCRPLEECWNDRFCVAKSVPVPGGYSIDATHVTVAQYAAWLATDPPTDGQPEECAWNTEFAQHWRCPEDSMPPPYECWTICDNHPVVCVDWCDAYAYCKAVGKRLCGKIGGGPNAWDDYADASLSQWYNACSSGGQHAFPYGDSYSKDVCPMGPWSEVVGLMSGCQSSVPGYEGVYDMSSIVAQWENSCHSSNPWAGCRLRGAYRCDYSTNVTRDFTHLGIGFRCCSL